MSYKDLKSYQNTVIIYDFTAEFAARYIDRSSRTKDQMVQAARSAKQNIVEGSAQKNLEGEIYLLKIARGSLKELLEDYEDFLRTRGLSQWKKDSPKADEVRQLAYQSHKTHLTYKPHLFQPESAANAMLCLINQTTYLMDQQLKALERQFIEGRSEKDNLKKQRDNFKKKEYINRVWRKHQ
jgi:restriction system protein